MLAIHQLDRPAGHNRRNRMFIDELRVPIPAQQNAKIIEPGDDTLQLYPVDEKDRERSLLLPYIVEKRVLKAWYFFGGHVFSVFVEGQLACSHF